MESQDRVAPASFENVRDSVARLRKEDKLRLWQLLEEEIGLTEKAVWERDAGIQSEIRGPRATYDAGGVSKIGDSYGAGPQTIRITAELTAEKEGGYSVYCPELDIYTQGETEPDCLENLREAAELHLEELGDLSQVRQVIRRQLEVAAGA
jgi:predicted RNase H-like HicB family nuclease